MHPNLHTYGSSAASAALGVAGAGRIDDTARHEASEETERGFWIAVQALTDVTFGPCDIRGETGIIVAGDTLSAGQTITLPFTALQLQSGVLIAIRG